MTDLAIDYEKLAGAIAEKLTLSQPGEYTLWDSEQCASYLRQSRRNFVDRTSKHPSFPKPLRTTTTEVKGASKKVCNCWYASEVIAWAAKRR
ncbi:hypothetical protein ACFVYJ_01310 [Pontibacter sp. JAM-7]|uniref:hypothetical protein n=1 Tax=Pontibacter sp. JAM-7 TaxID=3366581 RepID=UPI003AF7D1D6